VVTTEYSDWATNCPEYKVTAVQVVRSNMQSDWQKERAERVVEMIRVAVAPPAAE
jgi:formate dehydrogenase major subunit